MQKIPKNPPKKKKEKKIHGTNGKRPCFTRPGSPPGSIRVHAASSCRLMPQRSATAPHHTTAALQLDFPRIGAEASHSPHTLSLYSESTLLARRPPFLRTRLSEQSHYLPSQLHLVKATLAPPAWGEHSLGINPFPSRRSVGSCVTATT